MMHRFSVTSIATSVLLLLVQVDTVSAACPPEGCGPFGKCHTDTRSCGTDCKTECRCQPGYAGSTCSFQVVVCDGDVGPNGVRACFNGGVCAQRENYDDLENAYSESYCDCREASGEAAVYAGHQCEYPVTTSCFTRGRDSDYSFCVNDGVCRRRIEPGQAHPGCFCVGGYEGRHCQYKKGTAPEDELVYTAELETDSESEKKFEIKGLGVFLLVVAALAFVGGIGYFLFSRRRQSNGTNDPVDENNAPHDLKLDETSPSDPSDESDSPAKEII